MLAAIRTRSGDRRESRNSATQIRAIVATAIMMVSCISAALADTDLPPLASAIHVVVDRDVVTRKDLYDEKAIYERQDLPHARVAGQWNAAPRSSRRSLRRRKPAVRPTVRDWCQIDQACSVVFMQVFEHKSSKGAAMIEAIFTAFGIVASLLFRFVAPSRAVALRALRAGSYCPSVIFPQDLPSTRFSLLDHWRGGAVGHVAHQGMVASCRCAGGSAVGGPGNLGALAAGMGWMYQ